VGDQPVVVVPHTHWDREWYLPFQSFRLSLVRLVDKVLDMLEADPRFVFTLDGQLQTVDDYLEVRPEAGPRIRALVEEGRLAVGPWQTLVDEFLVSGEAIVRNLERGLARGDELGGAMRIGYLPDMFGHVTQMPQILRLAGIEQAVVWRGVPEAIDRHAFLWQGLDGSEVRAEYLPRGYGNAAHVFAHPERLADELEALQAELEPFFDGDPLLAMYGNDHTEPEVGVVELVEAVRDRVAVELNTLSGYFTVSDTGTVSDTDRGLARVSDTALRRWRGELRSGARANLLMGVTSARIDLKQAAARAERAIERYAEPLQALYGQAWPGTLLDLAWRRVLENSAHDSICGCSTDEVSAQVLVRYAEAEQIARGLADEAVRNVARSVERGSIAVVNPSPHLRADVIELGDGRFAEVTAPPLGWTTVRPDEAQIPAGDPLDNGLVAVSIRPDGTLDIVGGGRELSGVGRLVDSADAGDSYNYAPRPDDVEVDEPEEVRIDLRGREVLVVRTYRWRKALVEVTMHVEVRPGEPFVRLRISFDNPCPDHRLRFHVPLPERAEVSYAEGQFAVVERGLEAEGGHGEVPLPTFPARGFVDAGGVAVLLEHVLEYELVDGRQLALTLLRAIGLISRRDNPYREVNAGPEIALPAAQCRGPWSVGFALYPHTGSWHEAGVLEQMERYQHPFLTAPGTGESAVREHAGLELSGDGVVLSALRRRRDRLEARVVCERPEPCEAVLVLGESEVRVDLRPWEIRTIVLRQGGRTNASLPRARST
jgi:alpha-mannosidase